jgi:enterochelin esterase family protein
VDGRSRYGGSQFINSPATGNYADYVVEDVVPAIERKYATTQARRFIAGHSSGGYGALMLAMSPRRQFNGVIALSPDSDFETTHKPIVQEPSVRAVTRSDLEAAMAPVGRYRLPRDGTALLVMGLSANYTATPSRPGWFEWVYDDRGRWREDVWQRWIALDPLTLVQRDPKAFNRSEPVYLDGAQFDEFGANIGARRIHDVLKARSQTVTFYESPGHHSDAVAERLERGLGWALANVDASKSAK